MLSRPTPLSGQLQGLRSSADVSRGAIRELRCEAHYLPIGIDVRLMKALIFDGRSWYETR